MLGLVLLYFVGKAFYDLAKKHGKNKWLFAILGVVSYYGGIFGAGIVLGLIGIAYPEFLENASEFAINLMAIPVGVLICWGFYRLLKYQWEKNVSPTEELLDI